MSPATIPEPSRVADQVQLMLKAYNAAANLGWVLPHGTSFRCFPASPGREGLPDAAFILFARMPVAVYTDEGQCQTVPDVVIKVVAPGDRADAHMDSVMTWLTAGVRLVWELFPNTYSVYVSRPDWSGLRLRSGDLLTGEDVLPGFSVPVADLFRLPGEPAAPAAAPVT